MQDIFFALDIGTRSVIGLIGRPTEDGLVEILDMEVAEHSKRAMIDGQIEDIAQVAKVILSVKTALEERIGFKLTKVNVAAAGRALKTLKSEATLELNHESVIDQVKISELESKAISQANKNLEETLKSQRNNFLCVGYSVMRYYLDDYEISTLIGHKGDNCKVEMIVTFLPSEVIESLYAVMAMVDLQVQSMTLEPIAAMNAVIPKELRSLNLALVDIGAGTSDIAVSNGGSVTAYAMATVAGDEITEAISQKYIVDFQTAEKIKYSVSEKLDEVEYTDILGNVLTISADEVMETITPALENLSEVICEKIVEVNGNSPSAVFLVGGASKIPCLCQYVSKKLAIENKRVAVGGSKPLKKTATSQLNVFGPEFVTPLGIMITAAGGNTGDDVFVTVNGQKIALFKKTGMSVMDVLLSAGYKYTQMLGTSGKNLIFSLNGEKQIIRGEHATPASITINRKNASLFIPVTSGDDINIITAVCGKDASATASDIVKQSTTKILLNDSDFYVGTILKRGDTILSPDDKIEQNDILSSTNVINVFDLCDYLKTDIDEYEIVVNGDVSNGGYRIKNNDTIYYTKKNKQSKKQQFDMNDAPLQHKSIEQLNQIIYASKANSGSYGNNIEDTPRKLYNTQSGVNIILNGLPLFIPEKPNKEPIMFFDVLPYTGIDATKPQGKIVLKLNQTEASYTQILQSGDVIEVYWE